MAQRNGPNYLFGDASQPVGNTANLPTEPTPKPTQQETPRRGIFDKIFGGIRNRAVSARSSSKSNILSGG